MDERFEIGATVDVHFSNNGELYNHDFTGTVMGYHGKYVQVKDQEDDVWDCEPLLITLSED